MDFIKTGSCQSDQLLSAIQAVCHGRDQPGMNTGFHQKRVLVVDDESGPRQAIASIMRFLGMNVTQAADGVEALELYRTAPFDYVVTDHRMPRMCGDELAREIKALHPRQRIVMVSGFVAAVMTDGKVPATLDALLEKPCAIRELVRALRGDQGPML